MRSLVRILGTALIVCGLGAVAWGVLVWRWQDPFTALYTTYEQHRLSDRYRAIEQRYLEQRARDQAPLAAFRPSRAEIARDLERAAHAYRRSTRDGDPIGRIVVPRLGLNMVLLDGTSHDTLTKGPGRDLRTYMPGEGQLVYVAGHRTTYGAPFSHIDSLRKGDLVRLELPYGTFVYAITGHLVVPADDLAVLRSHGREVLALQGCHPRFFASHRYIAYARLLRETPKLPPDGGKSDSTFRDARASRGGREAVSRPA